MPSQRVYELAEELGFNRQELVTKINDLSLGFTANNYMTKLSPEEVSELKNALGNQKQAKAEVSEAPQKEKAAEPAVADAAEEKGVITTTRTRRHRAEAEAESADAEDGAEQAIAPTVRRRRKRVVVGGAPEETPETVSTEPQAEAPAAAEAEEAAEPAETPAAEPEVAETPVAEEPADEVESTSEPEVAEEPEAQVEPEVVEAEAEPEAPVEAEAPAAPQAEPQEQAEEPKKAEPKPEEQAEPAAEKPADKPKKAAETPEKKTPEADKRPAADSRRRRRRREGSGGARILGQIDTNVVKDRLSAEGKEFTPGPVKSKSSSGRGRRRSSGGSSRGRSRKRVVEGRDLYGKGGRRKKRRSRSRKAPQKTQITEAAEHKRVIRIEDVISVGDLAHQMGIKAGEVAMKLLESGMMATVNTLLDYETAALIADEFGYTVENVAFDISSFYDTSADAEETLQPRAPVVTVMGHVDHGKTSLLDAIRKSNVIGGEAGGITQHIGAYKVRTGDGSEITFLDTPGHEAFSQLRARGAQATDIVVLVIAADDGVMPQTVEAINHSRDAGVPIIVAINKVDKPTANPGRIKQALTEYELIPEEWGGTTLFAEVSAKQQQGIEELLEMIALQAELGELRANPERDAQGVIIEAELDVGRGPLATMLVQRGTLNQGDIVVSGQYYGRVRTMYNDQGKTTTSAGPSTPVEITGLGGIPEAGEPFFAVSDEKDAKRITDHVASQRRKEAMASRARAVTGSLEDISKMIEEGEVKELNIILKGDVQGSVEAVKEAFSKLGNKEVRAKVIRAGVGSITENDVNLAASSESGAVIVGFNVRPDPRAASVAESHGIRILTHSIIYDAINQINKLLESLLSPIVEERVVGHAEVRDLFSTPRAGTVAGSFVLDGVMRRNARARVMRNDRVIHDSTITSLRRFKDDVSEVKRDFECGISIEGFNDIEIGDIIEAYEFFEVAATL